MCNMMPANVHRGHCFLIELLSNTKNLLFKFERDLIRAHTGEGRERAKVQGVRMGRPPKLTSHQQREAIRRRDRDGDTLADIALRARREINESELDGERRNRIANVLGATRADIASLSA